MIILDQLTNNEVKYISRQGTPYEVILRDEQTKGVSLTNPSFAKDGYYTVFTLEETLIDNRSYQLTITDSNENVLYRDKIFVTTQEEEFYSAHKDEYKEYRIVEDTPSPNNSKYKIID